MFPFLFTLKKRKKERKETLSASKISPCEKHLQQRPPRRPHLGGGAGVTVNGTRTTESELPPGGFSNNFVPCRDP